MKKIKRIRENRSFIISYVIMAFIPMVVCSLFFYPQIYDRIIQQTNEEAINEVEKVLGELDQQQQVISNIPNRLYENQNIKRMDLENPWENLSVYTEIRNMIATNKNIKDCILYIRDRAYFISGYQGNISLDKLEKYAGKIAFCYDNWKTQNIIEELNKNKVPYWRSAESVTLMGKKQKNIITYVSSVPQNNRFAPWAVMVLVDGEQLIEGAKYEIEKREGYLLYDSNKELLYVSGGVGNDICSYLQDIGVEKIQQKESFRYGKNTLINAVQSESSGWTLVKISDLGAMISQLHALELKFLITMLLLAMVLSILGNYFIQINFRPIQQIRDMLIKAGKDDKEGVVNQYYQDIEHAIRILQTDNERMQQNLKQTNPKMRKHLFSEILSGSSISNGKKEQEELQEIDPDIIADSYSVAVFHGEDVELLQKLKNNISSYIKGTSIKVLFTELYNSSSMTVVFAQVDQLKEFMNKILVESDYENTVQVGIGDLVHELSELSASYSQACAALDYAMLNTVIGEVICYSELPDSVFKGHSYPLELIDSLAFSVRMNKKEDVQSNIQQIIYMMQVREVSPYYIRSLFYNVISIFMENKKVCDEYEKEVEDISIMMSQQLSSSQMTDMIKKCCELFIREKGENKEKEDEWMSQVRCYIEMHAAESSLSLVEVSEHIGMSPTWFSTLFKEKGGCSFKEYVDMVRLEKARALLTNTEDTIESIAEKVGYNNSYSFSRFFKKYTGATPNAYRMMKKDM